MANSQRGGLIAKIVFSLIALAVIAFLFALILPINKFARMEADKQGLSAEQVAEIVKEIELETEISISDSHQQALEQCSLRYGRSMIAFNEESGALELFCSFSDGECTQGELLANECYKEHIPTPKPDASVRVGNKEVKVFNLGEDAATARFEFYTDGELTRTKNDEFNGYLDSDLLE